MATELAIDGITVKIIGLMFFGGLWMFVAIRLLVARKGRYDHEALMPLDDEHPIEPRNHTT